MRSHFVGAELSRSKMFSFRSIGFGCMASVLVLGWFLQPESNSARTREHLVSQDETPASPEAKERQFQSQILPLIEQHCMDCHNDQSADGDFSMSSYDSAMSLLDYRNTWLKVLRRLETGEMPPADSSELSDSDRKVMVDWMDDHLNNIDCGNLDHPGSVTIRRLTKTEYRNTVRDLIGIDYEPAADFPADDVGYGFDNIGDVLSLPPILMEKYLNAAEDISRQAIAADAYVQPRKTNIELQNFKIGRSGRLNGANTLSLFANGMAEAEVEIAYRGRYEIHVRAYGQQAGDEPVKMRVGLDDDSIRELTVRAEEDEPADFVCRTQFPAGKRKLQLSFINDFYNRNGPEGNRDRNLYIKRVDLVGPIDYKPNQLPETHRNIIIERPSDRQSVDEASFEVLARLASRAYRRPASDEEIERLQSLVRLAVENGDSYEVGIQLAIQALLISPHFLFKVEEPIAEGETERELNHYELATSLSYFLWSTMPDDDLLVAAWENELKDRRNVERELRRMMADPRIDRFVENFATQWLQLRALDQFSPDPSVYPEFDDELRAAMQRETVLLFGDIVKNDRSVLELFDADYTFVNQRLADHYGIGNVRGDGFQRVTFRDGMRAGILTHASVLTVTSNPSRTSPVKRGKWIIENVLGEPPPPPAPEVVPLENQDQLTGTLREKMEQHRDNPSCASCHAKMDPLGFALENFDALGRWRDDDGGGVIDASGVLPSGESFDGPAELRKVLLTTKRDQLVRCIAQKLLTYALGRGLEYYDECAIDEIVEKSAKDNYSFSSMLLAIIESEPFQRRRLRQVQE